MSKKIIFIAAALCLGASLAQARVNVNVNIGTPYGSIGYYDGGHRYHGYRHGPRCYDGYHRHCRHYPRSVIAVNPGCAAVDAVIAGRSHLMKKPGDAASARKFSYKL